MFFIKKDQETDDPRREFLVKALSMGAFATTGALGLLPCAEASLFGQVPKKISQGKSIFEIKGAVQINKRAATKNTIISPNDTIETGDNSQIIFVVGKDALLCTATAICN